MYIHTVVRRGTLSILVVSVAACDPSEAARLKADSAVAAQSKAATQAVISARREAQVYFDSARAAFLAKRATIASKEITRAAAVTRAQADSASGVAKTALRSSAAELARLATRVTRNRVKSVKTLDYTFARTQLAEAQFHHERAVAAFRGTRTAAAGAELIMAADHFERAIVDAGQTASEPAQKAIADARRIASKLTSGALLVPADVESALATLGREVRSFAATAATLKA